MVIKLGGTVRIKDLDIKARIVEVSHKPEYTMYGLAYWFAGDRKFVYVYDFEIEVIK